MSETSALERVRLGGRFWRLWWANAVNSVGDGVFAAAMPLLAVTVTKDPQQISLISAASYLPWLLVSLPAGAIVDRYDRATLMWRFQAFQAVVVIAVAVATAADKVSIPALAVAGFLLGSAQVVITNAAQSVLPQVVPAERLQRANGNQYMVQTVGATSLGPPLGSMLFALTAALPFVVDAGSFVLSAILLASLPRALVHITRRAPMRTQVAEGLRWLSRHKLLRTLAILLGVNSFCNRLGLATLVLFATQTLHLSNRDYGLVLVGEGVGSLIGGLASVWIARRVGSVRAFVLALAGNVAVYVGMGLAPNGASLAVMLALCGFMITLSSVVTVSLRQQIIPGQLLGRVNSVFRMLGWGLMPLGALVGGFMAQEWGLRAPFLLAAAVRALVLVPALPILITEARAVREKF
ncbi:MFS transporter [Streptomyces sp. DG2A-72]|uniref:MFS transporter n=1 Tax=Streptomyces sp. DG2A-72 TaxID=3051386 RepID=UPI00265BAFF9|nr:MFS transporter [Streptomyces sp. DG2A-72]MDO0933570.1 MFS transporter [Streptomyces sp. DG2A-72]